MLVPCFKPFKEEANSDNGTVSPDNLLLFVDLNCSNFWVKLANALFILSSSFVDTIDVSVLDTFHFIVCKSFIKDCVIFTLLLNSSIPDTLIFIEPFVLSLKRNESIWTFKDFTFSIILSISYELFPALAKDFLNESIAFSLLENDWDIPRLICCPISRPIFCDSLITFPWSILILEIVIFWLIKFPISLANFWAASGSNVACNFKASSFPCNFAMSPFAPFKFVIDAASSNLAWSNIKNSSIYNYLLF